MGGERVESQGFYEMLWDCDHCETKGLLGKSQRHCAGCGAPQNPDKRYFPKPDQQQPIAGHTLRGRRSHCPACNAPMGAEANNCTQCGAPMDGASESKTSSQGVAAPEEQARSGPTSLARRALLVLSIYFFFWRTKNAQLAVDRRTAGSARSRSRNSRRSTSRRGATRCRRTEPACSISKQRSTKQVPDGEDVPHREARQEGRHVRAASRSASRNTAASRDDDWCTFTVRRWKEVDKVIAKGDGLTPAWPTTPRHRPTTCQILGIAARARRPRS